MIIFFKAHIDTYTRKDGTVVAAHEDKRVAARVEAPAPKRAALPETIDVDGKQRPISNSKEQPIHPTEEGVRNFWRWFGNSKVVDDQGRPLVVYHGTDSDFEEFSEAKLGANTNAASALGGFFFAGNPATSYSYVSERPDPYGTGASPLVAKYPLQTVFTERPGRNAAETEYVFDEGGPNETVFFIRVQDSGDFDLLGQKLLSVDSDGFRRFEPIRYHGEITFTSKDRAIAEANRQAAKELQDALKARTPQIIPVHLSILNPLVHDYKGSRYRDDTYAEVIAKARRDGHDGVILKNTYDGGPQDTIFVAFNRTQIKSAIGNNGDFDPKSAVITKSHPATQAMSGAAKPSDLNEPGLRRNPGEPSAEQAEADAYNKPRIQWQGLTIAIENPAGSVRRGRNRNGATWEIRMRFDYGEVVGSMGVDGDPVDIYMGPNPDAPMVYVVHQNTYGDWTRYDEDKCMVGFDSQAEAEAAFLSNYDDPRFLGPVTAMPVAEFVAKVRATKEAPAMIKAQSPMILFFKSRVGAYLRGGKIVNVAGYQGRNARATPSPGQMSLFGGPASGKPLPPSPLAGAHPVKNTPDLFDADEHGEMPPARRAVAAPGKAKSWVIKDKATGSVIMETFDAKKVSALNTAKYEAVPILEHLQGVNRANKQAEPRAELIKEHERLVDVLRSPSHEDDKVEAEKQAGELAELKGEAASQDDPERTFYHVNHDAGFRTIAANKGRFGGGVFALRDSEAAKRYGTHSHKFHVSGRIMSNSEFADEIDEREDDVKQWLSEILGQPDDDDVLDGAVWLLKDEDRAMGGDPRYSTADALMEYFRAIDDSDLYAEVQKVRGKIAKRLGASAIQMNDEFSGDSHMLLHGDGVEHRGVEAIAKPATMTKSIFFLRRSA